MPTALYMFAINKDTLELAILFKFHLRNTQFCKNFLILRYPLKELHSCGYFKRICRCLNPN